MKHTTPTSLPCHHLFCIVLMIITLEVIHVSTSSARPTSPASPSLTAISMNITVDIAGGANFRSVQAAINSVPSGNTKWVRIFIKRGIYNETVQVGKDKSFVVMEGEGTERTVIQWGNYPGRKVPSTSDTATFTVRADNFVARWITFKNSYNEVAINPRKQAVAAMIQADKVAFYSCNFVGSQDTLFDKSGRHFFHNCYIEGFVDFIFGSGRSIYELCNIWVRGGSKYSGYITAQKREDPNSLTGFVFKQCIISGAGRAFLGRPWGTYPFVLFYQTYMSTAVDPRGWFLDPRRNQAKDATFVEKDCYGPGSYLSNRVKWEKNLTNSMIRMYTNKSFIDSEGWLQRQPGAVFTRSRRMAKFRLLAKPEFLVFPKNSKHVY